MIELALVMAIAMSGQFEGADAGVGARVAWRPAVWTIEAEVTAYPSEFPDDRPFSRGRVEGLFGVTAGPTLGRLRPFARLRPGFLAIREAPRPFPCILIYPPPIECALARGHTLAVLDAGGGVEWLVTERAGLRFDAGDRMVRYPGPVFVSDPRRIQESSFWGHDVRFAASLGVRF